MDEDSNVGPTPTQFMLLVLGCILAAVLGANMWVWFIQWAVGSCR